MSMKEENIVKPANKRKRKPTKKTTKKGAASKPTAIRRIKPFTAGDIPIIISGGVLGSAMTTTVVDGEWGNQVVTGMLRTTSYKQLVFKPYVIEVVVKSTGRPLLIPSFEIPAAYKDNCEIRIWYSQQ